MFNNDEWLEQVSETVIDPERDICGSASSPLAPSFYGLQH